MSLNAFNPTGTTKLVAASSSTGVAATQVSTGGDSSMHLANPTTSTIYAAVGSSSVAAVQPTTAIPATGLCLPGGSAKTITSIGLNNGWCSAVTSAGTAAPGLFATPGFGQ
jgi:hypothetical protein